MSHGRARLGVAALFAGGFLGPFGGGLVASMLPEIGASYAVAPGTAAASLTAYLLPFGALMLVSGTLGERWGRARTVRLAYLVYVAASLACALAPTVSLLLLARVVQGSANAFTTPLLLAALAAVTDRERLGRALGLFGSLQAAGQTFAPLVGGVAAEVDWRYAFVGVAGVAALLAAAGLPEHARAPTAGGVRLREALRPDVLRTGLVALVGWGALGGLSFLVAFRAEDDFGLSATGRGLLLTGFGVAGLLTARVAGGAIDRVGARRGVVVGSVVGALLVAGTGVLPALWAAGLCWALAGVAAQLLLVGVNTAVLTADGGNRGGAVSVVQAMRFLGASAAPLALTPVYGLHPVAAFLVPTALLALVAPAVMPRARRAPVAA
ncbi:MFS transporter [Rhodococcus aerolatus]